MTSVGVQLPDADGLDQESPSALCASPRLFDNRLLDKLSRVHWSTPLLFYTPLVVLLAWLSFISLEIIVVGVAAVSGYIAWTLLEYFGHRYVFHTEFPGKLGSRVHFLLHGVHHDHPNDPLRLVMPLLLSVPIMASAFLVISLLLDGQSATYPTMMGFIFGYLIYDMLHYAVHHAELNTRPGRSLRRLHMLHHFHDAERSFAISAPWWDRLFGTACRG